MSSITPKYHDVTVSSCEHYSGGVLAWVGATAIIWVPLVVLLTLFWGRLRPTPH